MRFVRAVWFILVWLCGVRAYAQPGTISTYAGAYPDGFGGPARQVVLNLPGNLAQDSAGNLYIAGTSRIYRLSPSGRLDNFAGTGVAGFTGDGGPAVQARITGGYASGMVFDGQGNLIFSDGSSRIRQISPNGIISTIAGTGVAGFSGDGGPALMAKIDQPADLAVDAAGNLYFADTFNYRVRQISPLGIVSTVAGNGTGGYSGDGGPATQAQISGAAALAVDSHGTLYMGDTYNGVIRKLGSDGTITTIAGLNQPGSPKKYPNGDAINWSVQFAIAFDRADNLYITINNGVLKRAPDGTFTFVLGTGNNSNTDYQGPAVNAPVGTPRGVLVDPQGNLYAAFADQANIGMVDTSGNFSLIAGVSLSAGTSGPPAFARLYQPSYIAFDPSGVLYVMEGSGLGTLRKLTSVTTSLKNVEPQNGGMTFDAQGNLYYSDIDNQVIWKIDSSGQQTAFAGQAQNNNSRGAFGGDGGPALKALLWQPGGLAFDRTGTLYFADTKNNRVRKVTPDGMIQTVAGNGTAGFGGDSGLATQAQLNLPSSVVVDGQGNLYIADSGNARIRKVAGGVISTFAGMGKFGYSGDGGAATAAVMGAPRQMTFDGAGNLHFSDSSFTVRKITPNGIISTVAGNGNAGLSGDGGPGPNATLATPIGVAIDAAGNIYIADRDNNRIRKVQGSAPFSAVPATLLFAETLGGPPLTQSVTLNSSDGSARQFQISSSDPWLSVTPASGSVNAGQPATLKITVMVDSLKKGTYFGSVTVSDPGAALVIQIPVTLTVSGTAQQLRLSQVGLTFTAIQGGAAPASQSFQVLNAGTGVMAWTASSGTPSWLTVAPSSGSTTAGGPAPFLTVSANPAGLSAGSYYAQINVSAPSADNSPQSAVALLNVLPSDGTPGAQVSPSGLLFTGAPGATPTAQSIAIGNPSSRTINYTAAVRYTGTTGWLTVSAADSIAAGQSKILNIQPHLASLAAGVYRASLTLSFTPDNITRTVDIALVVNAAVGQKASPARDATTACSATQLVSVIRRPGASYQTAAGWPVPMEAAVVDDCGSALNDGAVLASFSTNDPVLALYPTGSGIWQATWSSRTTTTATTNVTITVKATSSDQKLVGQTQVAIRSDLNPDQPSIAPGGILDAASFQRNSPVSPGEYISIFGSRLAKEFLAAGSLPLPPTLGDTVVSVGGKVAPLHFASDGQVNAIVPYGIPDSTNLQMIIRRGTTLSLPEPVLIGATHPAVFTYDGSGSGQGDIFGYDAAAPGALADNAHPVRVGDIVLILATGLGPVSPSVQEGQASPADPPALATSVIKVNIQGRDAQVSFAGLEPGYPGIFQVNAVVPDGVSTDPAAPLIVSAGGQPSPPVTLAITQ